MKKNNSFKIQNLNFIKVNYSDSHIKALFKILKDRKINSSISHKKLPTYKEHKKFVLSMPYRYWLFIRGENINLGSVFVSRNNEISINLLENDESTYAEVLHFVINNFKPLKAIPSKRNSNFILNISPKNKFVLNILKKFKTEKVQETYKVDNKIHD